MDRLDDELRPEYDLSKLKGGIKGKYAEQYRLGTNVVVLESDVAQVFSNESMVNETLRMLIKIAQNQTEVSQYSAKAV